MNIALVMIVKDEEESIGRCLRSARPYISSYVIADTGSKDRTKRIINKVLGERVPGRVYDLPFVNFGHNRSEVLAAARGTADWILCLDADVTVEVDKDFDPDPAVEAYMVDFGWPGFVNRLPLLIRGDLPWKSVGAVHECTVLPDRLYVGVPTDKVRIKHHRTKVNGPEKWAWHASLLEAELAQDPSNARSTFYLAETYRRLGDPRAREMYLQRADMPGFIEETFYARYMAASLAPDWETRLFELLMTWESRPWRVEPLYDAISELNRRGKHHTAYRLSVPGGPHNDTLFVHANAWDWGMMFERSISAWWVGQKSESRELSLRLLENPNLPQHIREAVIRNLALTPEVAA